MGNRQMNCATASPSNFTSSSSAEPQKRYDVFLSFRGEDTRIGFTSYLYNALKQKQVETYIDNRLERGDEISPALMKAIGESHVSIIIFSENYASSKWCLEELSKIMECWKSHKQAVIPVFYRIDPSHVRKQTGSYEQAFANHVGDKRVHKWKVALTEAANLAGFHVQPDRNELEFVNAIAEGAGKLLNLEYPNELEGVFGIEERLREIESSLKIGSNEVRIIGIWGMGGIGKTTLASALYIKFSFLFDGVCFLRNLGEESKTNGSNALGTLLFNLLREEQLKLIEAPDLVPGYVKTKLSRKKVFIVLDDVTTLQQYRDLIINRKWLGSESKVIVTSRNKHALSQADEVFEVMQLNHQNSIELFCAHAFSEKHPQDGHEELLGGVIEYCKGIPLALKVLGALLHGKTKKVWKDELNKLESIPNKNILEVLKVSYDSLEPPEKDIFLDIAFFFKGHDRVRIEKTLEAFGFFATSGIQHLIEMALITVSSNDAIGMHDLIQEMAFKIVHQESPKNPERRSRLCNPEEVRDVLQHNRGTEAIEGISLDVSKIKSLHLNSDSFTGMTNIRYLDVYGDARDLACGPWSFPPTLRILRWLGYGFKSLPSTFCAKMLVELNMPGSSLEKLWDGTPSLDNLKRINLGGSRDLVEVPDLSTAQNLDYICLFECERLREVHPSILSLPRLRVLILSRCRQIESLKTDVHSTSLETLGLGECSSLKEFSVTSEEMKSLDLKETSIHELPSSFWRNRKLYRLLLTGCGNLDIYGKNLGGDGGLGYLHELALAECKQLNASGLRIILGGARSLTRLYLGGCYNLEALPDNIKNLSKLEVLDIDNCTKLVYVPKLPPSLFRFSAVNCTSLDPNFPHRHLAEHVKHGILSSPDLKIWDRECDVTDWCASHDFQILVPGDHVPDGFICTTGTSITIPHLPLSHLRGFVSCNILPSSKYSRIRQDGSSEVLFPKRYPSPSENLIVDHLKIWFLDIRDVDHKIQKNGDISLEHGTYCYCIDCDDSEEVTRKQMRRCGVIPIYATDLELAGKSKSEWALRLGGSTKDVGLKVLLG